MRGNVIADKMVFGINMKRLKFKKLGEVSLC